MNWFSFNFQSFAFSFLSILFEGIPFLLLGSLLSGAIDVFVSPKTMTRLLPKNSNAAILISGLLGMAFPMCECGSVILIRRFIKKGAPVPCAVTYMLSAPIVSPIVALSTFAAFRGQNPWVMTSLRLLLGFSIAVIVGFIVSKIPLSRLLQKNIFNDLPEHRRTSFRVFPADENHMELQAGDIQTLRQKLFAGAQSATSDFLDVAVFLIIGAALAAVFNTSIHQDIINPLATNSVLATVSMMALAFALALCSTSDAFIAASFVSFPFVAKLAFLIFGPIFDIKLLFLYGLIFKKRFVIALGAGLFIAIALVCIRLSSFSF